VEWGVAKGIWESMGGCECLRKFVWSKTWVVMGWQKEGLEKDEEQGEYICLLATEGALRAVKVRET